VTSGGEAGRAFQALQHAVPALERSATNPHFKSRYIPLEAIHDAVDPLLVEHGFTWSAFPAIHDGRPAMRYELRHVASGEVWGDVMPLLLDKENSQGLGSAITYARRYAISAVLGIVADEDDDGHKAANVARKAAASAPPREAPAKPTADGVISEAQRRRLFAIAATAGRSNDEVKAIIVDLTGQDSSKGIPRDKYEAVVAAVEASARVEDIPL
jgi:hypothetical protein